MLTVTRSYWKESLALCAMGLLLAVPPLAQGATGMGAGCIDGMGHPGHGGGELARPPYEGTGMAQWDETEMQATWFGTFVRISPLPLLRGFQPDVFPGPGSCTLIVPPPGAEIPGITSLEEFQAIRQADLQGFCFTEPVGLVQMPAHCAQKYVGLGRTGLEPFAEILGVRSIRFTSDTTLEADVLLGLYSVQPILGD